MGRNGADPDAAAHFGTNENVDDSADKNHCKEDLEVSCNALSVNANCAAKEHGRHGQENFSHVDFVTQDFVSEAESEGVAKKVSADKTKSRGVGPDDGNVNQQKKPRIKEAVVVAKDIRCVGESSAGVGIFVDEVVVIDADDEHDCGTHRNAKSSAKRACQGKELGAGHDKRAPAHSAAKGQSPYVDGT